MPPFQSSEQIWACTLFNQVSNFEQFIITVRGLYRASFCLMICNYFLRLYEKQYCMFAIIVEIVKTMFRFWPRSPSSLNQSRSTTSVHLKLYLPQTRVGITCVPRRRLIHTESRLTHLVRSKCVGFPVVEHFCTINTKIFTKHFIEQFCSIN